MIIRIASFLLILVTLVAGFSRVIAYAGYQLNREYIAKVLCENRNKPQMQCRGKCFMAKKLKQAEENEQKQERQSKPFSIEIFIEKVFIFKCYTRFVNEFFSQPVIFYCFNRIISIFHPPGALAFKSLH